MKIAQKILTLVVVLSVIGVAGSALKKASASPVRGDGSVTGSGFVLGQAQASAHLSKAQAIEAAKRVWSATLFTHPFTVEYGSMVVQDKVKDSSGVFQPIGKRDVWKITISGLNVPRPGGRFPGQQGSATPTPIQTFVIYVDDKAGTYLEAEGL